MAGRLPPRSARGRDGVAAGADRSVPVHAHRSAQLAGAVDVAPVERRSGGVPGAVDDPDAAEPQRGADPSRALDVATPPASSVQRPARAPTTAADDALDALAALDALEPLSLQFERGDTRPAPLSADLGVGGVTVTVEELIDLEQQVDFFMVLGQDDAAIELLSSRLNHRDAASGLPFLKLMEALSASRRRREAFDRVGARFAEQFHARAPSWSDDLNQGEALETHGELIERLEAAWSDPEGSMSLLQDLLSNHQEYGGDLGCRPIATCCCCTRWRGTAPSTRSTWSSIDVVLPLDATAPADQMATMVWQSPAAVADATHAVGGSGSVARRGRRATRARGTLIVLARIFFRRSSARSRVSSFFAKQKRMTFASLPPP